MEKAFIKPYEQGWASKPAENSWVTPQIMDNYDQAINEIDNRVIEMDETTNGLIEDLTQFSNDGYLQKNLIEEIEQGSINNAQDTTSSTRCRTKGFIDNAKTLYINIPSGFSYIIAGFNASKTVQANVTSWTDAKELNMTDSQIANYPYIRIIFKKNDDSRITPTDLIGTSVRTVPSNIELKENLTQLETIQRIDIGTLIPNKNGGDVYAFKFGNVVLIQFSGVTLSSVTTGYNFFTFNQQGFLPKYVQHGTFVIGGIKPLDVWSRTSGIFGVNWADIEANKQINGQLIYFV